MLSLKTVPELNNLFRLQFEEVQNCYVLLYPEGMVKLNNSASTVLKRCDGKNNIQDIIENIKECFGNNSNIEADVMTFIQQAYAKKWLI